MNPGPDLGVESFSRGSSAAASFLTFVPFSFDALAKVQAHSVVAKQKLLCSISELPNATEQCLVLTGRIRSRDVWDRQRLRLSKPQDTR